MTENDSKDIRKFEFGEVSSLIIRYQIETDLSLRGMVVEVNSGRTFPFVGKEHLDRVLSGLMK